MLGDFLGVDKLIHFVVSFAIATYDPVLSFILGIFKEAYDGLVGSGIDAFDLVANWLGILVATI